mmetsp:Transcript_6177/g.21963  ORF Transcript_6177/g.21963 Transcript_6177/m.21963 type:complete len:215 (-) Transcript_6177:4580-5224(-)
MPSVASETNTTRCAAARAEVLSASAEPATASSSNTSVSPPMGDAEPPLAPACAPSSAASCAASAWLTYVVATSSSEATTCNRIRRSSGSNDSSTGVAAGESSRPSGANRHVTINAMNWYRTLKTDASSVADVRGSALRTTGSDDDGIARSSDVSVVLASTFDIAACSPDIRLVLRMNSWSHARHSRAQASAAASLRPAGAASSLMRRARSWNRA